MSSFEDMAKWGRKWDRPVQKPPVQTYTYDDFLPPLRYLLLNEPNLVLIPTPHFVRFVWAEMKKMEASKAEGKPPVYGKPLWSLYSKSRGAYFGGEARNHPNVDDYFWKYLNLLLYGSHPRPENSPLFETRESYYSWERNILLGQETPDDGPGDWKPLEVHLEPYPLCRAWRYIGGKKRFLLVRRNKDGTLQKIKKLKTTSQNSSQTASNKRSRGPNENTDSQVTKKQKKSHKTSQAPSNKRLPDPRATTDRDVTKKPKTTGSPKPARENTNNSVEAQSYIRIRPGRVGSRKPELFFKATEDFNQEFFDNLDDEMKPIFIKVLQDKGNQITCEEFTLLAQPQQVSSGMSRSQPQPQASNDLTLDRNCSDDEPDDDSSQNIPSNPDLVRQPNPKTCGGQVSSGINPSQPQPKRQASSDLERIRDWLNYEVDHVEPPHTIFKKSPALIERIRRLTNGAWTGENQEEDGDDDDDDAPWFPIWYYEEYNLDEIDCIWNVEINWNHEHGYPQPADEQPADGRPSDDEHPDDGYYDGQHRIVRTPSYSPITPPRTSQNLTHTASPGARSQSPEATFDGDDDDDEDHDGQPRNVVSSAPHSLPGEETDEDEEDDDDGDFDDHYQSPITQPSSPAMQPRRTFGGKGPLLTTRRPTSTHTAMSSDPDHPRSSIEDDEDLDDSEDEPSKEKSDLDDDNFNPHSRRRDPSDSPGASSRRPTSGKTRPVPRKGPQKTSQKKPASTSRKQPPQHNAARKAPVSQNPPPQPTSTTSNGARNGSGRNDGWSEHEHNMLFQAIKARREAEAADDDLPKLKDQKFFVMMEAVLKQQGIHNRSWSACKNYWTREGRAKSNYEERYNPRNPGSMRTSVQVSKKTQGGKQ